MAGIPGGLGVTQANPKGSEVKPALTKARSLCSRMFNRPWKEKGNTDEMRRQKPQPGVGTSLSIGHQPLTLLLVGAGTC